MLVCRRPLLTMEVILVGPYPRTESMLKILAQEKDADGVIFLACRLCQGASPIISRVNDSELRFTLYDSDMLVESQGDNPMRTSCVH
jgi:hypothetical protein